MKFKLGDLWKTTHQRILIFAAITYCALISYVSLDYSGWFFISALLYTGVAMFIAKFVSFKKVTSFHYFFLGGLIYITYNTFGLMMGWFEISYLSTFMIVGSLQQGLIAFVIANIMKVK